MEALTTLTGDHPIVGDVRGLGLLCAIELVSDRTTKAGFRPEVGMAERLTAKFGEHGLILPVRGNVIPITPPLTTTRGDVDRSCTRLTLPCGRSRASWASRRWLEEGRGAQPSNERSLEDRRAPPGRARLPVGCTTAGGSKWPSWASRSSWSRATASG